MDETHQIFQTDNPSRWKRLKWGSRVFLLLIIFAIVVVSITLRQISVSNSQIPIETRAAKRVLLSDVRSNNYKENELGKDFKGFKKFINKQWAQGNGCGQKDTLDLSDTPLFSDSLGIRATFYTSQDPQSFFSLKNNIQKVNLVIPEWFYLDPKGDSLITKIDKAAFDVIKGGHVQMMPKFLNSYDTINIKQSFSRIISDKIKKEKLINDILKNLRKYKFAGININLDDIKTKKKSLMYDFQQELYEQLKKENFLVSQSISPFNPSYNYDQLADFNDYLFLESYDEHNEKSKPGSICDQKWIESSVDYLVKNDIDASMIVLNMATYGYDWQEKSNKDAKQLTYQQALVTARESEAVVDFDNNTYNLFYQYSDDKDSIHDEY
jgi:spore germination protein YaaH